MTNILYTHRHGPDSSVIDTVYYDDPTSTLYVLFNNYSIAGYSDVPLVVFTAFRNARSAGAFYNSEIRGEYRGVSVEPRSNFAERTTYARPLGAPAPAPKQKFTVTGAVLAEDTYDANSMEEAVEMFLAAFGGKDQARVKSVRVDF